MALPSTTREIVLVLMGGLALGWYFFCLIRIGRNPNPNPLYDQRNFEETSVTTISTTLATIVGLVLGLQIVSQDAIATQDSASNLEPQIAAIEKAVPDTATDRSRVATDNAADVNAKLAAIIEATRPSLFQWVAFGLYIVSLMLAVYFWYKPPAGQASASPVITSLAKSLLGVFAGALSALLAVRAF